MREEQARQLKDCIEWASLPVYVAMLPQLSGAQFNREKNPAQNVAENPAENPTENRAHSTKKEGPFQYYLSHPDSIDQQEEKFSRWPAALSIFGLCANLLKYCSWAFIL